MSTLLSLFDQRVLFVALALFAAAGVAARTLARRWGCSTWMMLAGLASAALVALVTIANRSIVVSHEGVRRDLTWWTRHWSTLPRLVSGDLGWWSNVALFVPAGAAWMGITHSARRTIVAAAVASFVVETLQATVLSGSGDPTDVVANVFGGVLGVVAAVMLQRVVGARIGTGASGEPG